MTNDGGRSSRALVAGLLGTCAAALVLVSPTEAQASDEEAILGMTAIVGGAFLIGADIAFTAYTAAHISNHEQPADSWMIAQSVVAGAQTIAINAVTIYIGAEDDDEEGLELLPMLPAIWTGSLATFSTWTLATPGDESLNARMGLSVVAATNLAFTATAIGSLTDRPYTEPYYISIPQIAFMAPECVLAGIQAARDPDGRAGWAVLSAWSGVLAVHGVYSLVTRGVYGSERDYPPPETPTAAPTPPADPTDPYYIDPAVPALPPPPPVEVPAPAPAVVPTPIPGGASIAPGLSVIGLF
ncbi:MAG: hypothetical protein HOW73_30980 [Polyangiaceae bacterium]|nr:hypothetical protein [Polyangiaceae bacterium]